MSTLKEAGYYAVPRTELLELRSWEGDERVLDVGCGAGATGILLRRLTDGTTFGWERNEAVAAAARSHFDVIETLNVELAQQSQVPVVDVVILADVLEHLVEPERLLCLLRDALPPSAELLVSVPNVRHVSVVRSLVLCGDWRYTPAGIMDVTHLRWYTKSSLSRMLSECGWPIEGLRPKFNTSRQVRWNNLSRGLATGFLAEQWLARCKRTST